MNHIADDRSGQLASGEFGILEDFSTLFTYTGDLQQFTVPTGVTNLTVELYGASGGNSFFTSWGGNGGMILTAIPVTPGEILNIYVGRMGDDGSPSYNGGGRGTVLENSYNDASGGGAADIRRTPYTLYDRLAVAGGGGGGTYHSYSARGGDGGYPAGLAGETAGSDNEVGGAGGTAITGGAPSPNAFGATAGDFGNGGMATVVSRAGGGGGGGYYGGGGGYRAAGGGGSSYTTGTLLSHRTGMNVGNGYAIVYWSVGLTAAPTRAPTGPTRSPTTVPTKNPTRAPTRPTTIPTTSPTPAPSVDPTRQPTAQPSSQPSCQPSLQPSRRPTGQPNAQPSSRPTCKPFSRISSRPSAQPSAQPSKQPSRPSSQPSSQPSAQPSTQPSINPLTLQSILYSPTYRVRNGFAFAVVTTDGKGLSWGEAVNGGDSSTVQLALQGGVVGIAASRFAYAAVTSDGFPVCWGINVSTTGLGRYAAPMQLSALVASEAAFAGVDALTGRVVALGSKHHGGDVLDDAYCNGYSQQLSSGVRSITASSRAFAAIKTDGTLVCWGNLHAGADVAAGFLATLHGVQQVVATVGAFAVVLADDRVAAWGDVWLGGDASPVFDRLRNVHHLTASRSCFAAFRKDASLVFWGYRSYCGDTSSVNAALSSHVVYVSHTFTAMVAVKADGSVAAWGDADAGGDGSAVQASLHDVVRVYGNSRAFAAVTASGGVVAWGRAAYGGSIPVNKQVALTSGVVSIYHTDRAFAALKDNGSLVVWGQAGLGGEPSSTVEALLTSGVHTVCANDVAFSAIKTDGSVVVWGHSVSVAVQGVLFTSASLTSPAVCA